MDSSLEFSNSVSSVCSIPARCRIFKIIVIGDSNVGKTCLTHRWCAGEFPDRTEATIGVDFRERVIDIEGKKIKLQLWDTAGQERFRKSMVHHYYRNVHAVLFVYDVTSPTSFHGLPAWIEECRQNSLGQEIPWFLVGNKIDLRDQRGDRAEQQVSRERAAKFAEAHGMTLFETSAKSPDQGEKGMGGRGGRGGGVRTQNQESVEAVFLAVGARLSRQRRVPEQSTVGGHTSSFKIPAKKRSEKNMWSCTC
ncbi:ras-related protein Rab-33B [Hypomesus transpacificus]|uniref:ras-related protein Rab-33B n=1 Tax=Hypomesus transpacificus TaxID=137520 RepID=UPI001F07B406|nr:ras-related protein Rab-33B [Hypomesus transpacificus]